MDAGIRTPLISLINKGQQLRSALGLVSSICQFTPRISYVCFTDSPHSFVRWKWILSAAEKIFTLDRTGEAVKQI